MNAAPWPPERDAEAISFAQWLESEKYGGSVDALGWFRWGSEWRMHMANNSSDGEARRRISVNIDEIRAGKPTTAWAAGPYDLPWSPEMDAEVEGVAEKAWQLFADHERALDHLGRVRWFSDYRLHRAQGLNADAAWKRIERDIKAVWGIVEPAPEHPGPLKGRLVLRGGLFADDTGPVLPMFCHFMEAFSAWCHGREADVTRQCQTIAGAGYHGIRVLDVLGYYEGGWYGREVTPIEFDSDGWKNNRNPRRVAATRDYWEKKRAFLEMLHGLGLKVMDDRGDLNSWTDTQKFAHMRRNGELYASMGQVGREVLAGLWACNESFQNGVTDPAFAARMIAAFGIGAGWLPDVRGLSWSGTEMPDNMIAWSIDPATVGTMHGNRVPNEHIIGHYLGYGYYDGDILRTGKRTWNTEPVGGGDGVSVGQVNDVELLCGIALEALMTGQAWTHMSGNGVFWNGPIEAHPGFYEVPRLLKWLPKDLHTFGTIGHAGTRFRGTRILAAIDDPPTRADYAIHADGRVVMNVYGEHAPLPIERPLRDCQVIDVVGDRVQSNGPRNAGDRFTETYQHSRLVIGKLA